MYDKTISPTEAINPCYFIIRDDGQCRVPRRRKRAAFTCSGTRAIRKCRRRKRKAAILSECPTWSPRENNFTVHHTYSIVLVHRITRDPAGWSSCMRARDLRTVVLPARHSGDDFLFFIIPFIILRFARRDVGFGRPNTGECIPGRGRRKLHWRDCYLRQRGRGVRYTFGPIRSGEIFFSLILSPTNHPSHGPTVVFFRVHKNQEISVIPPSRSTNPTWVFLI